MAVTMSMSNATAVKTASGLSLVTSMHAVLMHGRTQLAHFERRQIDATAREAEMIRGRAEALTRLAERWQALADSITPSS